MGTQAGSGGLQFGSQTKEISENGHPCTHQAFIKLQNHGVIETIVSHGMAGVGRDLKDHLIPTPPPGTGTLSTYYRHGEGRGKGRGEA